MHRMAFLAQSAPDGHGREYVNTGEEREGTNYDNVL